MCVCTTLNRTEILKPMLYTWHYMLKHHPDMHIKYWVYMVYMSNVMGMLFSGTCIAITCEVKVAVSCFWHIYEDMLCIYAHIACLWHELYLEYSSHISSVIYVKYMHSVPCWMIDVSDFKWGIYMCIHPPYIHVKYLAYIWYIPCNYVTGILVQ